jgi:hypothetical protein
MFECFGVWWQWFRLVPFRFRSRNGTNSGTGWNEAERERQKRRFFVDFFRFSLVPQGGGGVLFLSPL